MDKFSHISSDKEIVDLVKRYFGKRAAKLRTVIFGPGRRNGISKLNWQNKK